MLFCNCSRFLVQGIVSGDQGEAEREREHRFIGEYSKIVLRNSLKVTTCSGSNNVPAGHPYLHILLQKWITSLRFSIELKI